MKGETLICVVLVSEIFKYRKVWCHTDETKQDFLCTGKR